MSSESQSFICEHCNNEFHSISSLNYHQKNALFCLNIQQNINNTNIPLKCEYCEHMLSCKKSLSRHLKNCKKREVKHLENINKELSIKLENITQQYELIKSKIDELTTENIFLSRHYITSSSKITELLEENKFIKKNAIKQDKEYMQLLSEKLSLQSRFNNNL